MFTCFRGTVVANLVGFGTGNRGRTLAWCTGAEVDGAVGSVCLPLGNSAGAAVGSGSATGLATGAASSSSR